jgi:hypothetical protein
MNLLSSYRVRYEWAGLTEVARLTLLAGPSRQIAFADGPLLSPPSCAHFSQGPQHDMGWSSSKSIVLTAISKFLTSISKSFFEDFTIYGTHKLRYRSKKLRNRVRYSEEAPIRRSLPHPISKSWLRYRSKNFDIGYYIRRRLQSDALWPPISKLFRRCRVRYRSHKIHIRTLK